MGRNPHQDKVDLLNLLIDEIIIYEEVADVCTMFLHLS